MQIPGRRQKSLILPRISVSRPVAVTMCLVFLLVIGAVAYSKIRLQAFPLGREWRYLWVWVDWPNASPQEKDQQVCRLFMEYLSAVKNFRQIRTCARKNWTDCQLAFRPDTDMSLAYNQVMDRLERMRLALPEDVRDRVGIWKYSEETDQAVIWMAVSIPDHVEDKQTFLERGGQAPLERIDGVARVTFWGVFQKSIQVEIDQDRLRTRGVSPYELVRALQQDNFALAGVLSARLGSGSTCVSRRVTITWRRSRTSRSGPWTGRLTFV